MKLKGWLIVSGALVLVIAGAWGGKRWYDYYKYTPKLNPHPRYFVTVQGHVDPRLEKALRIQWVANYYTTNPDCVIYGTGGRFAGATVPRTKNIVVESNPNSNGTYSVQIPIDQYKTGYCKWRQVGISYKIAGSELGSNQIAWFSLKANKLSNPSAFQDIVCKDNHNCRFGKYRFFPKDLSYHQNYTFTLNIIGEY